MAICTVGLDLSRKHDVAVVRRQATNNLDPEAVREEACCYRALVQHKEDCAICRDVSAQRSTSVSQALAR